MKNLNRRDAETQSFLIKTSKFQKNLYEYQPNLKFFSASLRLCGEKFITGNLC
jgi:hypothetical protein